jgi:hypothetical protein
VVTPQQARICRRFGAQPDVPAPVTVVGVGPLDRQPLNGLRHRAVGQSNGWYVWSGDLSDDDDFFRPVHVEHMSELAPASVAYLALPPGWRFQVALGHEDVWYDAELLEAE